jgi:hypothetical protein
LIFVQWHFAQSPGWVSATADIANMRLLVNAAAVAGHMLIFVQGNFSRYQHIVFQGSNSQHLGCHQAAR